VSGPVSEGYLHRAGWGKAPGLRDAAGARNGGRAEGPTQRRRAPQEIVAKLPPQTFESAREWHGKGVE